MTAVRCFKLFTSPTLAANAFPYVTWKLSRTYARVAERQWDEYLWQEDERLREEKDERKRKYNVTYSNEVTQEDMEAYRMKKVHFDDPMKEFLKS
jgi:hypothetical protein